MRRFKELQELRTWYWGRLACDLHKEAEEELNISFWKYMFNNGEERIKELQVKKFEVLFEKMLKSKRFVKSENGGKKK